MTTGHVFIATSLDGFIARKDGGLDWLEAVNAAGEDHGYEAFMANMAGIFMGRETFGTAAAIMGTKGHCRGSGLRSQKE